MWCCDRIDQTRPDGDVPIPEPLEVQIDLDAMYADIGDRAAWGHNVLAGDERGRDAHRLDRSVDAAPPVSCRTALAAGSPISLTVAVPPNRLATCRPLSSGSIMMISAGA
jgi:hypothetical protein